MPSWVDEGYREYAERLPGELRLELRELPLARRSRKDSPASMMREEAVQIRKAIPAGARTVALEVKGRTWSTEDFSGQLERWLGEGRDVALLIGGPDGLDKELSASCDDRWSLSPLTLPHPLVRVVVAEQVYRAWSLLRGHPYHRS